MQNKWQSNYKTNGNPDTKQMAIHIQHKWQSKYKTKGNISGLPFVLYLDCHMLCNGIATCFVYGLPFQIKTNDNLEYVYTLYT
jgi:hypothetical protein